MSTGTAARRQHVATGYGVPVPADRRHHTPQHTVVVDNELWRKAQRIAKVRRETVSEVLRRALVDYTTAYAALDPDES